MKAIHADPKEIRKIFIEKYTIPNFQRPYSWDTEACEQLWEDIISFNEQKSSKDEKYFLGNIVVHPNLKQNSYVVIDGQQRLTTLLLLIKCLYARAGTIEVLETCLKVTDNLTNKLTDEIRIETKVIAEDMENLRDIVLNNAINTPNCKLKTNYEYLGNKLDRWIAKNQSSDKLNDLILTILDQIVLLPIHCGSEDDALTIFETINNRGIPLTDADIFKAKLHNFAHDKNNFITKWNELEDHEWLFRLLMHIKRAEEKDNTSEIALRTYFTKNNSQRLANVDNIMHSLSMLNNMRYYWDPKNENISILLEILNLYPNYYWNFPISIFLHKNGTLVGDEFVLTPELQNSFIELLKVMIKYFYVKGVVHNSVNTVKDTVFKVGILIQERGQYLQEFQKNMSGDMSEFRRRINNCQYGKYLKGLILLTSYINPNQNKDNLFNFIINNYHFEHILPKKWNNYDGWTVEQWSNSLNTIGNMIPLEYKLNISAKNEFFNRKKDSYLLSKIQDALELMKFNDWQYSDWEKRHNQKTKLLLDFFSS